MAEISEFIRQAVEALMHPDTVMLGGLFVIFVIGFACGVLAYEIHCIKHQIMMHRYHSRRRDK